MQRNSDLVRAIHEHWVLSGVGIDSADEMADELSDHLASAEADGKDVEDVVGTNLRAFADQWAEPVATKESLAAKLRLILLGAVVFSASSVGAPVVFEWTSTVTVRPIETGFAAILGGSMAAVMVGPATSRLGRGAKPRSGVAVVATFALTFGLLMASWFWLASKFEEAWTVTVPGWLALACAVLSFAIVIVPFMNLLAGLDRTDGWTKKILNMLGRFF